MLLLAIFIGSTLIGGVFGGVRAGRALTDQKASSVDPRRELVSTLPQAEPLNTLPEAEGVARGEARAEEPSAALLEHMDEIITDPDSEDIVLDDGFRIGPVVVTRTQNPVSIDAAREVEPSEPTIEASSDASAAESHATPSRAHHARRRPPARPAPPPRLGQSPGQYTILVARQIIARDEVIRGSCYHYLTEVFARAGYSGWRNRRIVFRGEREGPYANLDLIRPGDWLYIVNDPYSTPVGTHSVMFVGWQDRARGYARAISHPGSGAVSAGRESEYDVSQTYRITRPIDAQ